MLVEHGGTAILSETPEIYGAEHLLTRRAISREVGEKLVHRIHWWEHYTSINEGEMDNNPSPGNKAGGLTTILEKSQAPLPRVAPVICARCMNMPNLSLSTALSTWIRLVMIL